MKDGFININKASEMTSHDVVNIVRKALHTKKVGHAGTLDPFAIGVLPIAVGRATKFIEYLSDCDKSYRAQILFGLETETGDITGKVSDRNNNFKMPILDKINETLNLFTGTINQTPPKFSAIKINGRKAYELARKNVEFDIPSRQVTIYKMSVVEMTNNTLTINVDCSKGTYIRSLAVDIGRALNMLATLKTLQRIRVGNFFLSESVTIDELRSIDDTSIIAVDKCLTHLPKFNLPTYRLKAFCNGLTTRINENLDANLIYRVYAANEFIGTGKVVNGEVKADKLFYQQNQ